MRNNRNNTGRTPAQRWTVLFLLGAFMSLGLAGCFFEPDHGHDHDHDHWDHDHWVHNDHD